MAPNGTLYFFNANNLIAWKDGKELFRFHTQGKTISQIDTRNGFEILVFYQMQQSFQLFDNRLSELTPISKIPTNMWVNNLKQGVNNEFWAISNNMQRLLKLSRNLQIVSQQNQAYFEHLQLIKELNGKLIGYTNQRIMVVSNTGALIKEISFDSIASATLTNQQLYVCANQTVFDVLLNNHKKTAIATLPVNPSHFAVHNNKIYYLNKGIIQAQAF